MPRKKSVESSATAAAGKRKTASASASASASSVAIQDAIIVDSNPKKARNKSPTLIKVEDLFDRYKDISGDRIGPQGMERLLSDLGLNPEEFAVLVFAFRLNASTMGYFTKTEFVNGLMDLRCTELNQLKVIIRQAEQEVRNNAMLFSELFKFAFGFACEHESKKSLDLDTAAAMLSLLMPNNPHTLNFAYFLRNTKAVRAINRDQWACFWEFSKTVKPDFSNYDSNEALKPDFSNYDSNEAWPLLIDEYVEFVKGGVQ